MTNLTALTAIATRYDIWVALQDAIRKDNPTPLPVPRYVKDTECIIVGAPPLLILRLDFLDEALAWAEYLGIADSAQHHERPGLVGVSYMGDWLGWRVLLLGDENRPMPGVEAS